MSRESNKVSEDQSELFRAWDIVKRSDGVQHKGIEVDEIDGSSVRYPEGQAEVKWCRVDESESERVSVLTLKSAAE